ncbi:MAG TPA: hypothetical protein VGD40_01890 [Chryseosolibacter sp.]
MNALRFLIPRLCYRYLFLYRIYYLLYRKGRGSKLLLPNEHTAFHIEGYPRSGNTFSYSLIRMILQSRSSFTFTHHTHATASLIMAKRNNVPTIILIRHPLHAISSSYLKYYALRNQDVPDTVNIQLLQHELKQYAIFYSYVVEHLADMKIIDFAGLIAYPFQFVKFVAKIVNVNPNELTVEELNKALTAIQDLEKRKNPLGSSLPNERKQDRRQTIELLLKENALYQRCLKLYESACANKVNLEVQS